MHGFENHQTVAIMSNQLKQECSALVRWVCGTKGVLYCNSKIMLLLKYDKVKGVCNFLCSCNTSFGGLFLYVCAHVHVMLNINELIIFINNELLISNIFCTELSINKRKYIQNYSWEE